MEDSPENLHELYDSISAAIDEQLDDSTEDYGLYNICDLNEALEFVEYNRTMIMSDLFKMLRKDPEMGLYMLKQAAVFHGTMAVVAGELQDIAKELFEDELLTIKQIRKQLNETNINDEGSDG